MRSLQRELPLFAFALLVCVAGSVTLTAYVNVRQRARELAGERLARASDQMSVSLAPGIVQVQERLNAAATDPRVVDLLVSPSTADRGAAEAALRPIVSGGQGIVTGIWDLAGDLLATGVAADTAGWAGPPPLVEEPTMTPIVALNDTTLYYSLVTPVRSERSLIGFVQVRQRLRGGGNAARTLDLLVGDEATLLLGSPGGAWTDLLTQVEPPPLALHETPEPLTYERDGLRRIGLSRVLTGTAITLVAEIDEAYALAPTRAFLGQVGGIATGLVLIFTVAASAMGRRITRPLEKLRGAAEAVGRGDYGRRAAVEGHPEIASVAWTFNKMAAETQRQVMAIRESEQRFRSLVTATSSVVWWTDPEGNVAESLPSLQAFTGHSFDELRGAGWTRALHPDDAARTVQAWKEAVGHRSLFDIEYRLRRHDGEYRWMAARSVPILEGEGRIREWVCTCRDITQRKEVEESLERKEIELQQSQRLDAVGRLAGGIAHDFNNLLTAIMGPAELAAAELPEGHPVRDDLQDIRHAAVKASELTRQLLAFSRQSVMTSVVLDVNEVVDSAGKLLKRVIGEAVRLELSLNARRSTVRTDRTQFEQVIVNLAINARDAMPKGGQLTIETEDVELRGEVAEEQGDLKPGRYVLLAVSDTGIGMTPEVRRRIFEPFFSTKDPSKGTGLGLSTVYGIVRQSGGHIWVYSEVGRGTTFKIYLPFEDAVAAVPPAALAAEEVPTGTETILMAEDEAYIRQLGIRILTRLGYKVLVAKDGEDALRVAAAFEQPIHLLLSDIVMPGMDGIKLWEKLQESRKGIPALFLSGWASDAVQEHGILDGQVPFLQKPFSSNQLASKLREVLDAQQRGVAPMTHHG